MSKNVHSKTGLVLHHFCINNVVLRIYPCLNINHHQKLTAIGIIVATIISITNGIVSFVAPFRIA
jgi:hypothetical protein